MEYAIVKSCTGFEWDAGNSAKNQHKHDVSHLECEEVFFNVPLIMMDDPAHSQKEPRYYALGRTNAGRELFISFTIRHQHIRIISARPMSRKERAYYETHTEI